MLARLVVLPALALLPVSLSAQDTTTTPFRRGQWGAEFVGALSTTIGFVKFRSPTNAWTLYVRLNGSHAEYFLDDTVRTVTSNAGILASVGWRGYHRLSDKVVAHQTLGLSFGFSRLVRHETGVSIKGNTWSGGPFLDVGGTYLVTPHFGVGGRAIAFITYSNSVSSTPLGGSTRAWVLGTGNEFQVLATIFF